MTAQFGTDTSYSAMSSDFLALNLDNSDTIWGTGYGITKGNKINYGDFIHSMNATDGDETNYGMLQGYQDKRKYYSELLRQKTKAKVPAIRTVYEIVRTFPQLSEFVKLLDLSGWDNYVKTNDPNAKVTLIVPTNKAILEAKSSWFHMSDPQMIKEFLKSHTCSFSLPFDAMVGRKLEVYTKREGFSFYADGTGQFMPELNFYQKGVYQKDWMMPIANQRFKVVKSFETDNGMIYVIDGCFSPGVLI
jgi:hypothetical protein